MDNFIHYMPTKVFFGKGQISALSDELRARAKRVLIVTGTGSVKNNGIFDQVLAQVKASGAEYFELSGIVPNPRLENVYQGVEIAKRKNIDLVLGVGGGSVIDASKAIAAGAVYDGDVWDFYDKCSSPQGALPIGSVLTLAATGTEMNGNSVITKENTQRKLALSTPHIRPRFSILDPEYTFSVNRYHTAAGLVDIMVHIFEQYFSHTPADVQDRIAESLLRVCIDNGPIVLKEPDNYTARANILWASTLALNGLIGEGKESDWASHGIEHEVSAIYDISHGAGLAIISPKWMKHLLGSKTSKKFADYGRRVWSIDEKKSEMMIAEEAISRTESFFKSLEMPATFTEVGISADRFEHMAESVLNSYGQVGSFKQLSKSDIIKILNSAI